jgi:hypothetical protein
LTNFKPFKIVFKRKKNGTMFNYNKLDKTTWKGGKQNIKPNIDQEKYDVMVIQSYMDMTS